MWRRSVVAVKAADWSVDDPAIAADDVFLSEDLGLFCRVTRPEVAGRVDDAPPRNLHIRVPNDPPNKARHLGIAGDVGDIAVRRDLPLGQRHEDINDPALALDSDVRINAHDWVATRMFAAS